MRRDTCRDPGADKNPTITYAPSFSFSEYLERGLEQTGLSSDLKSHGVLCSLSFFCEVEVGEDSWQINDREPVS